MQPKATGMEHFRGKQGPVRYFATGPYLEVATKVRLAHEDGGFTEVSHEFVHVGDKDVIRICIEIKGQRFYGSAQIKWGGKAADATDPVENAETSARGRALAAAGYELGHMASADDMDRVVESHGSRWVNAESEALSAPQLALPDGHTWQSFAASLAKAAEIKTKSDLSLPPPASHKEPDHSRVHHRGFSTCSKLLLSPGLCRGSTPGQAP